MPTLALRQERVVKHALIIEDNAIIAFMIRDYLEEYGYSSVDLASTQTEAIQLAEQRCPDLITADERLEDGSGVEAIRHICRGRAIPVIFIVAEGASVAETLPDALLLLKPFSEEALARAIQGAEKAPLIVA
jgi:CheY-like chemotaxis protein